MLYRIATASVAASMSLSLLAAAVIPDEVAADVMAAPPNPAIVVDPRPVPPVIVAVTPTPVTTTPEPTPEPTTAEPTPTPESTPEPEPEPEVETVSEEPSLSDYPSTGFNGVKSHVARAGHLIGDLFGVSNIGGVAGRANASDHPRGLALDFMCNRLTGDLIAEYVLSNMDELNVKYVIWRQRINYGSGWEGMEDRGGDTANHYDHVHVSFNS